MKPKSKYSHPDFQFVSFSLSSLEFGLDVRDVKEIIRLGEIERPSGAPAFLEGFLRLRTILVPLIDLRKRFSLPTPMNDETRVIICLMEARIAGLAVDEVTDIAAGGHEAGSKPYEGPWAGCVDAVIETRQGPVRIINLKRLLSAEEKGYLSGPIDDIKGDLEAD
ncbi:MAG: hypothetical protein A2X99_03765 [Deltaproteobacteria bacterium GWB2_55_19]|nr:MAG: hypothetical protein A2X99_03765 [Deltaproteobacteria bacterium GWB2_55_19]HAO93882.1 hypothetical protein [Deltaproteobacteria bacterium]